MRPVFTLEATKVTPEIISMTLLRDHLLWIPSEDDLKEKEKEEAVWFEFPITNPAPNQLLKKWGSPEADLDKPGQYVVISLDKHHYLRVCVHVNGDKNDTFESYRTPEDDKGPLQLLSVGGYIKDDKFHVETSTAYPAINFFGHEIKPGNSNWGQKVIQLIGQAIRKRAPLTLEDAKYTTNISLRALEL